MQTPKITGALRRKSSRSDNNGGACVGVAYLTDGVAVRDSKDQAGPVLTFTPYARIASTTAVTRRHP